MSLVTILWRRVDTPGHDTCRLEPIGRGWQLSGAAIFRHDGSPAHLQYRLDCDAAWRSVEGSVRGWIGARKVDLMVRRGDGGVWTLNDAAVHGLEKCVDLDFGITPATNLTQLRRINLGVGQAADVPVAWLDAPNGALSLLEQRYERRTESGYWYEAPRFNFSTLLEVDRNGFSRRYHPLWEMENDQ